MDEIAPLPATALSAGIRSRFVDGINGLRVHLLEAGFESSGRPALLLLHGFPEIAYSWRKVMLPLAAAGYHVIAPDLRGYGRTTGWDRDYDGDLDQYRYLNLVHDCLGLVFALGYREVAGVFGHDFGATGAAYCALIRPDVFRSMVLMSAPFAGPPALPFGPDRNIGQASAAPPELHAAMAALARPRKHYHWYYATRPANDEMWHCPQGVHDFLRAYYHHKSADWRANRPFTLTGWTADEMAKMPTYYIMDLHRNMAETVAAEMPSPQEIAACGWLTEAELAIYAGEYVRNGFQGGLNWYRSRISGRCNSDLKIFSGRHIEIPSMFIAGASDWGTYQAPGNLERMRDALCTQFHGCHLIDGAGHWVQQEQPEAVTRLLLDFLEARDSSPRRLA